MKDLAWPELVPRLLAVPLGATEQHGPHLPFTVDTEIAVALCERLAQRRNDVVVAPALPYGSSGEHAGFPGTLSIGQEATEHVLVELVRSADAFTGVVLVCAHGGNVEPLRRAIAKLRYEGRAVRAWCPDAPPDDTHAGRTETSVMLALRPSAVRLDRLETGVTEPLPALLDRLRKGGVRAVSPTGTLGDPRGASAEEGRETLLRWVESLLNAVGTLVSDVMMKPSVPATHVTKR
ncbi:creatinine amidohydrolase [Amycolatopsis bartoniae]|uniref:Mycofactocin system creatininase family protein n=1 Tax=Amycolatopsis bartoniae TaxID=941986 RepID=A0A8H9J3H1_9PSEU|nr:mycofactocin biosynthesis peptidyl-dipeptidase MftE [Amycolatopsis bartoniae]MBB2937573.1 creatinine amidohydrolase [Amycolatopsis bartoniae]TVT05916.1 mycofactocin biosynthesis peptidyl-dipeptidase MftE [Amycolatopsis bartoniae]GHF82271.1 mycofactocin system creatininase family protein [Amycolatopsis bartoniae]